MRRAGSAAAEICLRLEGVEHVDIDGHLQVPLGSALDDAPQRKGWQPYHVDVVLSRKPPKWIGYRAEGLPRGPRQERLAGQHVEKHTPLPLRS
jgi:hypothetical protein